MAHLRKRYLLEHLPKALKASTLVGVLGQRQVGKTTLLESLPDVVYETLDDDEKLFAARARPQGYLENFQTLTVIDECQKAPELFPALKLRVQKNKKPGQFILTGSVRFTSRKSIQESLTGRILNLELLPMTLAESQHLECLDYEKLFHGNFNPVLEVLLRRQKILTPHCIERYMMQGGLPGICFLREESFRKSKMKTHLETLLQRDINFVFKTTAPYDSLLQLLTHLAEKQGEPFSLIEASRKSRLAQNTVKRVLDAYEALFLIRRVRGMGFRSAPTFYLEDQGMASYLVSDKKINYVNRFIFSQVFGNTHYMHMSKYSLGYYETKSGLSINLVAKTENSSIGFIYESSEVPTARTMAAVESFLSDNGNHAKVIILTEGKSGLALDKRIRQVPLNWIA